MRSIAATTRWAPLLGDVLRHRDAVAEPATYAALLLDAGLTVDVWETTYLHLLSGPDPVLEWVRGTSLRPVLAALAGVEAPGTPGEDAVTAFETEYAAALQDAYPATRHGTPFAFRRIFAVAHNPSRLAT
jgi:trans-aconitate 2-methyltransferase